MFARSILLLFLSLYVAGCSTLVPTASDPYQVYTAAAQTVKVELTREAALTPSTTPSPVPSLTPTLTLTSTPSPVPTPTLIPTPTWAFHQPGKLQAPILRYTFIGQGSQENSLYKYDPNLDIPVKTFEEQLQAMQKAGITPVTMANIEEAIARGGSLPRLPVAIIFVGDADGIYRNAFPLMKKAGFPGTVFVLSNHVDQPGMLSTGQLKEMTAAGWEIGSQGMSGYNLTGHHDQLTQELDVARKILEGKLGVKILSFAYPMGGVDDTVANRTAASGYLGAVGRMVSMDHSKATLYYLGSIAMRADQTAEQLIASLPYH